MHNVFFSHFRIKENVKKIFDGDNFWNICGVWEKSILLMMKIALFFTKLFRKSLGFLTFFLPIFWLYLYGQYRYSIEYRSENRDKLNEFLWVLFFLAISSTHLMGGLAYAVVNTVSFKGFTIGWLRLNLILVLVLVGLQAYVSYIKSSFSESVTKFEKIIDTDLSFILRHSQNFLALKIISSEI